MKAAIRCHSLSLGGAGRDTLEKQEKHGKRQDATSQLRRIRDTQPLVYGSLNLRAAYDGHVRGARVNRACKRPVLHFVVKFPARLLEDGAPGPYGRLPDRDARKRLMGKQAIRFINQTHGGRAVFAARIDRDEEGEATVDVFAAPVYEKATKAGTTRWTSPTHFGKELARRYQGEVKKRHPDAKGVLTGPRMVGIALQAAFAAFFQTVNGVALSPRSPKIDPRPDRLEIEAFKKVAEQRATLDEDKRAWRAQMAAEEERLARQQAHLLAMIRETGAAQREAVECRNAAIGLVERMESALRAAYHLLQHPDLPENVREEARRVAGQVSQFLRPHGDKREDELLHSL